MPPTVFTAILSALTIGLMILSVKIVYALVSKSPLALKVRNFVGPFTLPLAFLIALGGTLGSLIYSEVIGFPPCILCIIQRWFLYPQVLILGTGLVWKRFNPWPISLILSMCGGAIALYHSYTQLGGSSLLPCTAAGGGCDKVYFVEWGFITIPFMSFVAFTTIIVLMILSRKHRTESIAKI